MRKKVVTFNAIEGFHFYPNAPADVAFLRHRHRHVFTIRCHFEVQDSDREIEIFLRQNEIQKRFSKCFGSPAEFHNMSCEMIAEWLIGEFANCVEVEVLEDGFGGAIVQR